MLENIKSRYILKNLFSFLNENKKLKLIKYNKNLQKTLNINLITYMLFTHGYIIYDKNGKGKEYSYDLSHYRYLIFEGEYLNGERNGKGKEYFKDAKGKLKFEGEYLNGKKWNGKLYDKESNDIYELKDGKGFTKEYYEEYGYFDR